MKRRLTTTFIISFYLLLSIQSIGQTVQLNRLRSQLNTSQKPEEQLSVLIQIFDQSNSLAIDSLLKFINQSRALVKSGSSEYFRTENAYSWYLIKSGHPEKAIANADTLLAKLASTDLDELFMREIKLNKIIALIRLNKNEEAIDQAFHLLANAEKFRDTLFQMRSYSTLGWANMELGQFFDAIKWLNKGIALTTNEKLLEKIPALFSNVASSYNNVGKMDSAFYFLDKAFKYSSQTENLALLCNAYIIRSNFYLKLKKYQLAEADMQKALSIREQTGDPYYIVSDMSMLSSYYASQHQCEKGIDIAKRGIEIARKTNNLSKLIYLYQALAENYDACDMKDEYSSALEKILELKDTLYFKNREEELASIQTLYDVQKKENIILQQQFDLERNRYYLIGATTLFVLISVVIGLLYRNYKHLGQLKMEKMLQEQKELSIEAVLRAEEAERKRIAADLHDNLGSYAAAISANAKYIKEGTASSTEHLGQLEENASNMVTQLSDTIWVLKNEQLPFTSLCDRFKTWTQRLMRNYPGIDYRFSEKIMTDLIFSPEKMLHLFLIMKECLNNSLKHSHAKNIDVAFFSNKEWKITITDNGEGFEYTGTQAGSGLDNIQMRARENQWKVDIVSSKGKGTTISISGSTTK